MPGTVAVTGATGFIGSHIVAHLTRLGWRVRLLTRRLPVGPILAPQKMATPSASKRL